MVDLLGKGVCPGGKGGHLIVRGKGIKMIDLDEQLRQFVKKLHI